jgi:esterase/lipase
MSDLILEQRTASQSDKKTRKKKGNRPFLLFVCVWLIIICSGILGAKWYTERIQQTLSADLQLQTASQISAMQQAYEARMLQLETNYTTDLSELKAKVDALNELLTFTKDNAASKTDNSNKLYTQLNEVKKQLNELQKSLDVLK